MELVSSSHFSTTKQGLLVGLLLPLVVGALIVFAFYTASQSNSLGAFLLTHGTLARMLCLATLADAVVFFIATHKNRLPFARGLLAATFIYAFIVAVLSLTM